MDCPDSVLCSFTQWKPQVYCPADRLSQCSDGWQGPFYVTKYRGSRTAYYANSDATFQISILKYGDICPNPGPDTIDHTKGNRRFAYRSSELHNFSGHIKLQQLPAVVFDGIKTLGILRRRKTHRGSIVEAWTHRGSKKRQRRQQQQQLHPHSISAVLTLDSSSTREKVDHFNLCMLNVRSLRNKTTVFQDFVLDHGLDVVCICETWLTSCDDAVIADLRPEGFTFKHLPRASRRGGGIALLFRDELKLTVKPLPTYESFETMMCTLTVVSTSVDIVVIYRPPNTRFNKFLEDFSLMLDELIFRPTQ